MVIAAGKERSTVYEVGGGTVMSLGDVLARAGEGTIHAIENQPELVAKIFHPTLNGLSAKLEKIAAMVTSPPSGATQDDGFTVLTWPTGIVRQNGSPVGYVMPRIDTANAVEIHALSNPSNRANPLANSPQWPTHATWSHLVTVAANLCVAVDVVHHVDAVVGDFQERNILVADTCRVTLVDCDSMQFTDAAGLVYLCTVGRPEFSAPELLGHDLAVHPRSKESDLFALAIHLYQLLMAGNHPFLRGNWLGAGEQPGPMELAKTGDWTGGRNSHLHSHPLAPSITFLPTAIQNLFERAFTRGATNPSSRPTAAEWHAALGDIKVGDCPRGTHQVPVGTTACPWCAIDGERARRRKPAAVKQQTVHQIVTPPTAKPQTVTAPGTQTAVVSSRPAQPAITRAGPGVISPYTTKSRPPFKSTTPRKPGKKPAPMPGTDEFGRGLYRVFLFFAIPSAIFITAMTIWILVYAFQQG